MTSKTLSVSIPEEMLGFLEENPRLKPSAILQTGIENIQNSLKHNPQLLEARKEIAQIRKWGEKIQTELQKATEFITLKGLWEEYSKNE